MSKVAMVLSGCGHLDGSEIRESVLSILFLDQQQIAVDFYAPDVAQRDVINYMEKTTAQDNRNVLQEAARIARGNIKPLSQLEMNQYDGLVIPGGYGVAKNLSDFAVKGTECEVLPDFKRVIQQAVKLNKPIVAICIAPAVLAAALKGVVNARLTIGDNKDVASAITSLGSTHIDCATDECVVDEANKIISCSAYMREDAIADIADGIEKCMKKLAGWLKDSKSRSAA